MAAIAEVGAKDSKKPENEKGKVTIYFGVFFDGTNNHRLQVLIGKKYRKKKGLENTLSPEEKEIAKDFRLDYQVEEYINKEAESDGMRLERLENFIKGNRKCNPYDRRYVDYEMRVINENKDNRDSYNSLLGGEADNLKESWYQDDAVHNNDFTNISLLEPLYKAKKSIEDNEYVFRIYVSGCGTDRNISASNNSLYGSGTGYGSQGVVEKVKDAVDAIRAKLILWGSDIVDIQYHIFGFSRGAAEARILANILSKDTTTEKLVKDITNCKVRAGNVKLVDSQSSVKIPFVGLFDTVSSIGLDCDDNIKDYGLNVLATTNDVENVFHICALDEFRSHFSLTPVRPMSGKLLEVFLPGAHSDIGGGYPVGNNKSGFRKSVLLPEFPLKREGRVYKISEETLKSLGWYKLGDKVQKTLNAILINRYVKKGYSYISLHLMLDYACKKVEGIFQSTKKFGVPPEIEDYNYTVNSWYENGGVIWPKEDQYIKLRQNYLHFSAQEDGIVDWIVNEPNLENNTYVRKRYE